MEYSQVILEMLERIKVLENKVKAIAFEYTTNKDVKSNRMAIVNIESQKARKPFDWYKE